MNVGLRHWSSLLCLGLLARQVNGICEGQRYLRTDGYTFKFTVDVMFHLENADANDRLTILNSSTGAFQLYRQSDTKVVFTVVKRDDLSEVAVASTEVTSLMTWYTLTVEKTVEQACITIDSNVKNCAVAQHTDVGDAGEVVALNQKGVEVRHYLQAPVEHAQKFKYEASSGKLFQYFLVAVQDSVGRTFRDDYADVSSPSLGKYVKPKFGSFSRLQFECGYELGGVLGSIEIEGGWSWGPTPDAYHRALLATTVANPTLVEKTNVGFEPTLPPYVGDGRLTNPWNNAHDSFLATFGSGGYLYLNGGFQNENGVFACDPSSTVSPSDSLTWAPSPSGAGDTNRYIRVWLGQEVGTSPDTTATTTGTCTTTTTTTTSTSSTTSGTRTVPPTTTTTSSTATTTTATTIVATTTTTSTATSTETTSTGSSSTTSTATMTTMTTTTTTTMTTTATTTSATGTTSTTRSSTSTSSSLTTTSTTSSSSASTSSSTSTTSSTFSSTSTSSSTSSTNTRTTSSTSTRSSTVTSTTTSSSSSTGTRSSTTSSTSSSTTSSSTTSSSTTSSTSSVTSSSTTSSTSSSTGSTTTSSSWSSTTTTSTTSTTMDLSALMAWVSSHESALVDGFLRDPNASSISTKLPGLTMAVFWTHRHQDTTLDVEGSQASLMVPGSVLDTLGLERAIVVVSVFDSEAEFPALLSLGPLLATVNINFFDSAAGRRLQVRDVPEPFLITMPVNRSLEANCAYWDVERQRWSRRGMQEVLPLPAAEGEEGELLLCSATHLTLFGALVKGFLKAITCAQVSLLSMKAAKQVFIGGWWHQPVALMFWLLEVIFVIILAAACLLDYSRQKKGTWDNEFFLIPLQDRASAPCAANCPEVEEEQEEPHLGWKKSISHVLQQPINWCCQSSGCRQALDDVCSRWFKYFGEVRGFIETICEKIQCSRGCGMKTICASLAGSLLCDSVQRQVSASLGLSEDVVSCFLEDEDLAEFISEAAVISQKLKAAGPSNRWEERLLVWHTTHQKILYKFDEHWKRTSWSTFPMAFARLFYVGNPIAPLFLNCQYMTCSLRVLFFAVEIFGALLMLTLFHQVGGTMAEDADPECLEDAADIWEEIGSIMAIALGTILVANVPVMVLESLHTRSFRKFDYVGCPEWKRQLAAWKIQDLFVWIVGLGYIGFCGLFVVLFLANVAESELLEWGVTEGISLAEDCIIIPVAISFVVPSLAGFSLALASLTARAHPSKILEKQKAELEDASRNRKPFILTI